MGADYLDTIAGDILAAALVGLAESRTGIAPPDRVYVSHNIPAVDPCAGNGQLTVHLAGLRLQSVANRPAVPRQLLIQPIGDFVIQLWRCHPAFTIGGEIPSAVELDAAGGQLLTDLWCMETQLFYEQREETLVSVNCQRVEIGAATPLGPQGSAAGWAIPVTVALSDAGPTVSLDLAPAGVGASGP